MHTLKKIRLFRILLYITYPIALLLFIPIVYLKKKSTAQLLFFFDRYGLGGAQKVHLDILHSVVEKDKNVYFTRRPTDDTFKNAFYAIPNTKLADIHFWCDNILLRLFSVHFLCFCINRHEKIHVFSSNSTFFYDMLPFIKSTHIKTELLHNFTFGKNGMEFFGLANHQYLDHRIVVDYATQKNIKTLYKQYNVNDEYFNRVKVIEPGVDIPLTYKKDFKSPLKILYAGRSGEQKRVWLISQIAEYFISKNQPVEFYFAGLMVDDLSEIVLKKSVIYGSVSDPGIMQTIYQNCNVLILTSAYEGFPMVIKEAMANGCIPVVTALEGNKTHLTNNYNSLLIDEIINESILVEQGIEKIEMLLNNNEYLIRLSKSCTTYAKEHFDKKKFENSYRIFFK
jgi:glycosyltransferase involved in cell wall biosynthesis